MKRRSPGKPGRPTDRQREERLADAEALVLKGWTRRGAIELADKHSVATNTVERWRATVERGIRKTSKYVADTPREDLIVEALERNAALQAQAQAAGRLAVVRRLEADRCKLLGLYPSQEVKVSGSLDVGGSVDLNVRKRFDVSDWPEALLVALASGLRPAQIGELAEDQAEIEPLALLAESADSEVA